MKRTGVGIVCTLISMTSAVSLRAAVCPANLFVTPASYPTAPTPTDVLVGDFNGDGIPDVATLSGIYYEPSVSILIGNPDGTLQPAITTPVAPGTRTFSLGDFLVDGDLDVALSVEVGYPSTGEIHVLPGNGDGTFQPVILTPIAMPPSRMATGAFTDSGDLDLVGVHGAAVVLLLEGQGDGTFAPPTSHPTSIFVDEVVAGHLDSDGDLDVLGVDSGSHSVAALLGDGAGGFGPPEVSVAGKSIRSPVLEDFDGDGTTDLAVIAVAYAAVLRGLGDGTFAAPENYAVGPGPVALRAGDLDGDGFPDLIVGSQDGSSSAGAVRVLLGDAAGGFETRAAYTAASNLSGFAVADLGDDGVLDVVTTATSPSAVWTLLGNGDGTLRAPRLDAAGTRPYRISAADFDHDGLADLLTNAEQSDELRVFLQTPEAFVPGETIHFPGTVGQAAAGAGEFTGDGDVDVVALSYYAEILWLARGNGDGTFEAPIEIPIGGNSTPTTLTVADFDEDGKADVGITVNAGSPTGLFVVLPGNGDGTFGPPLSSPLVEVAFRATTGRFNADGHLDLAFVNAQYPGTASVSVMLGFGDGTFGPEVSYPVGLSPWAIATGDFDGDGATDLAVANSGEGTISLLEGNGDGTFADARFIGLGWRPTDIGAADFDADGNVDIVTANEDFNNAAVLRNTGGAVFENPVAYPTGSGPSSLVVMDVLGNQTPDVVIANHEDLGGLTVLLNAILGVAPLPDAGACDQGPAVLRALASGFGPLTYQWRKDGVDLADGGNISGVTTTVLTIDPATPADDGQYDVVVTDLCTTVTSTAAPLAVTDPPSPPAISVDAPPAPGVAGMASVAAVPGHGYTWTISGDADAVIVSGQGTSQITFLAQIPGTATIQVVEFSSPGCGTPSTALGVPVDFFDVPASYPFHADIVEVSRRGIAAGCGAGNFCPVEPVTRAQMAVFLLKSKFGPDHEPSQFGPVFDDVPNGSFAWDWINNLWQMGITTGCGNNDYCPDASVTRAQMAVFLLKTRFDSSYFPPFGSSPFEDVPDFSFAQNYILDLYDRGITGGCSVSPLLYCPDSPVNRGQMATFLVRTFLTPAP